MGDSNMGSCESQVEQMMSNMRKKSTELFHRQDGEGSSLQNEMKDPDVPIALGTHDRNLNILFRDDDSQLVKERQTTWPRKQDWEVLLERVAAKKKPLATVTLKRGHSKLTVTNWKRILQPKANAVCVRVIGPFADEITGAPTLSLVHTDMMENTTTLGELLTEAERSYFGQDMDAVFRARLEDYITGPDIRSGQNYLECALVYGYPLDRARETL